MCVCVYVEACAAMGRVGVCACRVHMHCGVVACGVQRLSASVCMCVCVRACRLPHTHPGGHTLGGHTLGPQPTRGGGDEDAQTTTDNLCLFALFP